MKLKTILYLCCGMQQQGGVTDGGGGGGGGKTPPLAAQMWGPFLEMGPLNSASFASWTTL